MVVVRRGCNLRAPCQPPLRVLGVFQCLFIAGIVLVTSCDNNSSSPTSTRDRISVDREARLQPAIRYVEAFTKDHQRLPTQNEFRSGTKGMGNEFVLKDHTDKYAASKGAKADTDYMVGVWRADWYHYYKSWDKSFLSGSDEFLN